MFTIENFEHLNAVGEISELRYYSMYPEEKEEI
jgi:hypothetical protein